MHIRNVSRVSSMESDLSSSANRPHVMGMSTTGEREIARSEAQSRGGRREKVGFFLSQGACMVPTEAILYHAIVFLPIHDPRIDIVCLFLHYNPVPYTSYSKSQVRPWFLTSWRKIAAPTVSDCREVVSAGGRNIPQFSRASS